MTRKSVMMRKSVGMRKTRDDEKIRDDETKIRNPRQSKKTIETIEKDDRDSVKGMTETVEENKVTRSKHEKSRELEKPGN